VLYGLQGNDGQTEQISQEEASSRYRIHLLAYKSCKNNKYNYYYFITTVKSFDFMVTKFHNLRAMDMLWTFEFVDFQFKKEKRLPFNNILLGSW